MAYDVAGARSEGYSDQEIAEHLAKERGYDLAGALKEGYKYADIVQHLAGESGAPDQADVQKNFSLEPAIGALAGAGTGTALTAANQGLKLAGRRLGVLPDNKTVSSSASGVADLTPNVLQRPHEVAARVLERAQQNNPFRPQGPSDVINWSSGTRGGSGQYQRGYMGGASQEIEANLQRQADALEARNPGYKVMPGDSSLLLRPADEVDRVVAQRAADVNRYNQTSEARANTAAETRREKLGQYESGRRAAERLKLPGKVTASLPVAGTALGYNAMDLVNRSDADDQIPQQVVSATGALGSAAMPLMNKLPSKLKWLAPAAAFGAPAINKGLDYIQSPEEVEGNKNGGSISHMKNGGLAQTLKNMFSFGKSKTPFDNFIDPSAVKSRMYHGSPTMTDEVGEGIRSFDPSQGKTGMTFLSPDPKFASSYAGIDGAVYPAFVQAKKPFDYANPAHITDLIKAVPFNPQNKAALNFAKSPEEYASKLAAGRWDNLERPEVIDAVKNLGYDAMYVNEHGVKNLGVFDPKRIKSAIGNRGTYDVTNPDITMAEGGGLYANIHAKRERIAQGSGEHMRSPGSEGAPTESAFEAAAKKAEGGLMQAFANGGHATAAWQRSEGKNPEGGLNAAGRASYNNETGGNLQPPVSSEAAKSSPKKAKRRKSFCARMEGNSGPMKDESGKPTRKALALRKWDC